jgi:hypothetical protein
VENSMEIFELALTTSASKKNFYPIEFHFTAKNFHDKKGAIKI